MFRSLMDSSIDVEFLISDESPYFSHYACEILCATDVACKSYERKRRDSSVYNHHNYHMNFRYVFACNF